MRKLIVYLVVQVVQRSVNAAVLDALEDDRRCLFVESFDFGKLRLHVLLLFLLFL